MSEIRASRLRMIGFSLPALGLNTLVTAVVVFLPALYAEHRGFGAAAVGFIFFLAYAIIIGLLWRYPISRDNQRQMREIIEERENFSRKEAAGTLQASTGD